MSPGEAKTYPLASDRSERFKRSLVCISSPLHSLRPLRGMARLGAPGGRVRITAILSILRGSSLLSNT